MPTLCTARKDQALLTLMREEDWALARAIVAVALWRPQSESQQNYFITVTGGIYQLPLRGNNSHCSREVFSKGKISFLFGDLRKFTTIPFKTFRHLTFFF